MTPRVRPWYPVVTVTAAFWAVLLVSVAAIAYVRQSPDRDEPGYALGRPSGGATVRRLRPSTSRAQDAATTSTARLEAPSADDENRRSPAPGVAVFVDTEPSVVRIGEQTTITVTLVNRSDRSIDGLQIFSSGPWDMFKVDGVAPLGRYDYDLLGATFSAPISIAPNQPGHVEIKVTPSSPGRFHFTFTPTPAPGQRLPRIVNGGIVIEAGLEVVP